MKRTRTPNVNLTFLAVRCPNPKPASAVMEPWRSTITDLCSTTRGPKEVNPMEIIHILEAKIKQGLKKKGVNSIFKKFNAKYTETYEYNATIHCEAALAAIKKFPGRMTGDAILRDHIQV